MAVKGATIRGSTILVLRTFIVNEKSGGDDRKDTIPNVPAESSPTDPSPKSEPVRTFPVNIKKMGGKKLSNLWYDWWCWGK